MANWPKDVEPREESEWTALAMGEEGPKGVSVVVLALKGLGYSVKDIMGIKPPERVKIIMEHQQLLNDEAPKSKKGAARSTTKSSTKSSTKAAAKATKASTAADTSKLEKLVEALSEQVSELQNQVAENNAFLQEVHFGFLCLSLGDPNVAANFESEDIQEELFGKLQVAPGEE